MSSLLSRNQSKMFPSDQTFFTPSYQEEFGYKTAQRVQCIRTGSSTGSRRNNPHPPHVRTDGGHHMGCTLCCVPQFKQLCVYHVDFLILQAFMAWRYPPTQCVPDHTIDDASAPIPPINLACPNTNIASTYQMDFERPGQLSIMPQTP